MSFLCDFLDERRFVVPRHPGCGENLAACPCISSDKVNTILLLCRSFCDIRFFKVRVKRLHNLESSKIHGSFVEYQLSVRDSHKLISARLFRSHRACVPHEEFYGKCSFIWKYTYTCPHGGWERSTVHLVAFKTNTLEVVLWKKKQRELLNTQKRPNHWYHLVLHFPQILAAEQSLRGESQIGHWTFRSSEHSRLFTIWLSLPVPPTTISDLSFNPILFI